MKIVPGSDREGSIAGIVGTIDDIEELLRVVAG